MTARKTLKIGILLIIAAAIAAIYFSPVRDHLTRDEIRAAVGRVRDVWYGPLVLVIGYALGCVFAVPASIFILSAGVIWGWKVGGTYAMLGGVLGATASFLVGRFVGEGMLERFGKAGRLVERQVESAGFKSLLVLRLIPLFPFAVINYGAGVARLRLLDFILATLLGLAPSNYVFAYSADSLFNGTLSEGDAVKRVLVVAVLILFVVLLPTLLKKRFRTPNAATE